MNQIASPLVYHRSRRDHQLRMLFSAASRAHNGKPLWIRNQGGSRKEILLILIDAIFHAREVARGRTLEWPNAHADDADQDMLAFLEEIQIWFHLLEGLSPGGDDPRAQLSPLLEGRIRLGQRLFHNSRRAAA